VPSAFHHGRVRRLIIGLSCLAVVLTGCTATIDGTGTAIGAKVSPSPSGSSSSSGSGSATAPDPAAPTQPAANFVDCHKLFGTFTPGVIKFPAGRLAKLTFTCTVISVPLDYADPTGRTTQLVLLRVHDSDDTHPEGQLLLNPGGPGGAGLDFSVELSAQLPTTVLDHYDLIGFDPRGVGNSSPVSCISDAEKDQLNADSPDVETAAGRAEAKADAKMVDDGCTAKYGSALADFNTVNTAKDMDQIREAVGDTKLNYLGFSYGTELGSVYAHLFPNKVRMMVLDGAVDPLGGNIKSTTIQLGGFEQAFDQFAGWCRAHSPCRSLGNARQDVYKLLATAARNPIPSSKPGETRKATPSLVLTGVSEAMYSRQEWPTLGRALTSGLKGDSAGLLALADNYNQRSADGTYSNLIDADVAISCNDSAPGPSDATIAATAKSWARRFPLFGPSAAGGLYSCQQWQPDRTVPPLPTAPTPQTVLVLGNLHDPATPYHGAIDLTRTMGHAELLSWNGEGHTSYLRGSSCVDNYVDGYLVGGTLPPTDTTCPR
jgi:pimeloyl-ACP methyl ester carboxylesterase